MQQLNTNCFSPPDLGNAALPQKQMAQWIHRLAILIESVEIVAEQLHSQADRISGPLPQTNESKLTQGPPEPLADQVEKNLDALNEAIRKAQDAVERLSQLA